MRIVGPSGWYYTWLVLMLEMQGQGTFAVCYFVLLLEYEKPAMVPYLLFTPSPRLRQHELQMP